MTIPDWGSEILLSINEFARSALWLQPLITGYARYGVVLFAGLLLAGWWRARTRNAAGAMVAALWAPLGTLLAVGINQPVADWIAEPRPYSIYPDLLVLVARSNDPALPSDHAVMAGSVTAGLFMVDRRLGWWTTLAAAAMAFARVYVAAHFPQDVLIGLVLGAVVSLIGFRLFRPLITRVLRCATRGPLRSVLQPRRRAVRPDRRPCAGCRASAGRPPR